MQTYPCEWTSDQGPPLSYTSWTWIIVWSFPWSCEKVVLKEEGGFPWGWSLVWEQIFWHMTWKFDMETWPEVLAKLWPFAMRCVAMVITVTELSSWVAVGPTWREVGLSSLTVLDHLVSLDISYIKQVWCWRWPSFHSFRFLPDHTVTQARLLWNGSSLWQAEATVKQSFDPSGASNTVSSGMFS